MRVLAFVYGLISYVLFLIAFLYAVGFVESWVVPKAINAGAVGPVGTAVIINVLLLGLFGVQHSVMARPAFKEHWTKIVPKQVERSTFVLITSVLLLFIFWQWRPMTGTIWQRGRYGHGDD